MEDTKQEKYEVLNPWADADPVPLKPLAARILDLNGKTIGLFRNSKRAAKPALELVEQKLQARFPTIKFQPFVFMPNDSIADTPDAARFEDWLKSVDAVIYAFGD